MGVCLMVILEVITFTGIPNEIKADEAFKGELFKEFESLTKTKLRISYPYNHHSNAKVERANKDARISAQRSHGIVRQQEGLGFSPPFRKLQIEFKL
jgi:hypothetical protein